MRLRRQQSRKSFARRTNNTTIELEKSILEKKLIIGIKRCSIRSIVYCYVNNVNAAAASDINGDNPIHIAIRTRNSATVRAVLLLFANQILLTKRNNAGEQPVELAYSSQIRGYIELFLSKFATRRSQSVSKFDRSCDSTQENSANATETVDGNDRPGPVLLSLDGGGIRGLILIRVLMHIEHKLGAGKKFWPLVNWVAGTSTGSILALALSKGKSLDECQRMYLQLKDKVFNSRRPYNPDILERILLEALGSDFMNSIVEPRVLITAVKSDTAPPSLVLFRNYALPADFDDEKLQEMGHVESPENIFIWLAARCSSAAPSYFPPFDEIYVDGGVICNNPTLELLSEYITLEGEGPEKVPTPLCVISLGTGVPPTKSLTIYRPFIGRVIQKVSKTTEFMRTMALCLVKQITESNGRPVAHSRAFCNALGTPFFRFSPKLNKDVRLNEANDTVLFDMLWDVEVFLSKCPHINELTQLLLQKFD